MFAPKPLRPENEGSKITVPAGFDAGAFKLTGNVTGEAPYEGELMHPGWTATKIDVPVWKGSDESALRHRSRRNRTVNHYSTTKTPGTQRYDLYSLIFVLFEPSCLNILHIRISGGENLMSAKYAIGIDLGTTNSALAYRSLNDENSTVECLPIPQLVDEATEEGRTTLPSFIYIGEDHWSAGEWARRRSAEVPARTVATAKSWLCHSRVNRHDPILPWGAPDDVQKISPVEASKRYLQHLAGAWNKRFPDAPFSEQQVVLTVPASFDASARELTQQAAVEAEFPEHFIMLEEPQSAVYAWLNDAGENWRKQLNKDDTLLVCDVGGGTTDFTLVRVEEEEGDLVLRRVAVGNHILVGGDNMDLLTAHLAQQAFAEKGVKVDAWQSTALWHACRQAKESLLNPEGSETHPVTVLGRGRSVIGGNISVDLNRQQVSNALLEGFFPACELSDRPRRAQLSGFRELGLPYEHDTAITRHLAAFLSMHARGDAAVTPDPRAV